MKRDFHISIGKKEIEKIFKDQRNGLPFIQIDGSNIHEIGFDVEQVEEYEAPANFPKCCSFHTKIEEWASDWYEKFPNCCSYHKKLKKKDWFHKSKYDNVVHRILKAISYTEYHISQNIEKENWYKLITDYIEYCIQSFGSPPVGVHIYEQVVKGYIETTKPKSYKFPKKKRKQLLDFFSVSEQKGKKTDLNILHSTFQKWLKAFPDLIYFNNLKSRFKDKFPISLILYEPEYNPYLGLSKMKARTNGELVKLLNSTTKKMLRNIDSKKLVEDKIISNLHEHEIELINTNHNLKQDLLLQHYSKGETKYLKVLKKWLKNEKEYFSDLNKYLRLNENQLSEKLDEIYNNTDTIKKGISRIENEFGELYFLLDKYNYEQKLQLEEILTSLSDIDETTFNAEWEQENINDKLNLIIESLNPNEITLDEKNNLRTKLSNSTSLSVKHKLKFTIPLILFKYEAEIELSDKQKLPKSWKEWKALLINEK